VIAGARARSSRRVAEVIDLERQAAAFSPLRRRKKRPIAMSVACVCCLSEFIEVL